MPSRAAPGEGERASARGTARERKRAVVIIHDKEREEGEEVMGAAKKTVAKPAKKAKRVRAPKAKRTVKPATSAKATRSAKTTKSAKSEPRMSKAVPPPPLSTSKLRSGSSRGSSPAPRVQRLPPSA